MPLGPVTAGWVVAYTIRSGIWKLVCPAHYYPCLLRWALPVLLFLLLLFYFIFLFFIIIIIIFIFFYTGTTSRAPMIRDNVVTKPWRSADYLGLGFPAVMTRQSKTTNAVWCMYVWLRGDIGRTVIKDTSSIKQNLRRFRLVLKPGKWPSINCTYTMLLRVSSLTNLQTQGKLCSYLSHTCTHNTYELC